MKKKTKQRKQQQLFPCSSCHSQHLMKFHHTKKDLDFVLSIG